MLGVDGGGTHTSACLLSTSGEFLVEIKDRPAIYARLGSRVAAMVVRLANRALERAGLHKKNLAAAAVCWTGVGRESDRRIVERALRRARLAPLIVVGSDAIAGLTGAFGAGPGIAVLAGTGSIAFARDQDGNVHRVGGWGYLLGDEGSGFAIARDGINAALKAFDGRGPATLLQPLLAEKLSLARIDEIISRLYRRPVDRGDIASLAPLVFFAAQNGDAVAQEIVHRAGRELGRLIVALLPHLQTAPQPVPVALLGNLFQQKDMLLAGLTAALAAAADRIEIVPPRFPGVVGAGLLALAKVQGVAADEGVLHRLESTYRSN